MENNNLFMYKRRVQDESSLSKVAKKQNRDICVAGVLNDGKLQLGIAICGKKEQFVKALARTIAVGRAEKKPALVVDVANVSEKEMGKAFVTVANDYLNKIK